jgi:hypothetical protein
MQPVKNTLAETVPGNLPNKESPKTVPGTFLLA